MTQIEVHTKAGTETYDTDDYAEAGGHVSGLVTMARDDAALKAGTLADEVEHQPQVVERAADEGAFVARVTVPYWFLQKDDEVAEAFGDNNERVQVLLEDYSAKAWRVIGMWQNNAPFGSWYTWSWTFLPKSVVTVTHVARDATPEEAEELASEARKARKASRTQAFTPRSA